MVPTGTSSIGRRAGLLLTLMAVLLVTAGLWLAASSRAGGVSGTVASAPRHVHAAMTDEEMARWVAEFYATHPQRGTAAIPAADPAETVFVSSFLMNSDGNTNTQVDTAKIQPGETVLFQWVSGTHTTTNGDGPLDPAAGTLWDRPMSSSSQQWVQAFPSEGVFPFFCRPHPIDMRGYVQVRTVVGVEPLAGDPRGIGFLAAPYPNPASGRVSFRFALREAGPVRAEVFDARGRSVAVIVDRELDAGAYGATWDGRTRGGSAAAAGAYRLRLTLPGYAESRPLVLAR